MKEVNQSWFELHKKKIAIYAFTLAFMVALVVSTQHRPVYSTDISVADIDAEVNTTLGESLELYAGIFSTTVTASVNPTATLAVLSILGTIENADVYAPDSVWMNHMGQFLNKVPIVEQVSDLPISNPVAAVILTIIAVVMIVLHSLAETKLLSKASIDNIEEWGGFIVTAGFSLLPLATTQVASAATMTMSIAGEIHYVSGFTYAVTLIVAILSAIFNVIVYVCVYKCCDAIGVICAIIPVKGMNVVEEVLKGILHLLLMVMQIFARPLSIAFSIIIAIIGIILARKLALVSDYYTYIYAKPLWNTIFHHGKKVPLIHRKFPRKGQKLYPATGLAIPVFSMVKLPNMKLKKREMAWLIVKDGEPYLAKVKLFKKLREIPLHELSVRRDPLYLQKDFRFNRIMTEDKQVELIFSNEYNSQRDILLDELKLTDYQVVVDRMRQEKQEKKEEKERVRQEKRDERARRRQEKREAWEEKMDGIWSKRFGIEKQDID